MYGFPLDNTGYLAQALGAWFGTRTRGVFAEDGHFNATPNGDMSITLGGGLGWLKMDTYWGVVLLEPNPQVLDFDTADGSLSRIDAVCLRINKNLNEPEIVVKKGAYSPQPPAVSPPARNLDYDEIYVATVVIRAGATSITAGDITDQRMNEAYCGLMRDGVTRLPSQDLYNAWWAWFDGLKLNAEQQALAFYAWIASFKATNTEDLETWTSDFKTSGSQMFYTWLNAFKSTSDTTFEEWFSNLQNQLDGNQAANLQNQIDQHKDATTIVTGGVHGIRYQDGKLQLNLGAGWATLARVIHGLRSTFIDGLSKTSFEIDSLQLTASEIDVLIEMEE